MYAANSDISSASVSLIGGGIVGNLSTPVLLDIYGYIGDGAVTTADWNVGSLIGNITWDGLSAITFDTTQFLSDILNDSAQWLGINIRLSQTAPSSGYIAFNTTYTLTTELSSADVPEPITLVLMMIGLIGLGFSTRQRQLIVIKSNSLK